MEWSFVTGRLSYLDFKSVGIQAVVPSGREAAGRFDVVKEMRESVGVVEQRA